MADDASYPDVFSHLGVLAVLQSSHPRPRVRKPAWPRRLVALVTKPGEKSGLTAHGEKEFCAGCEKALISAVIAPNTVIGGINNFSRHMA